MSEFCDVYEEYYELLCDSDEVGAKKLIVSAMREGMSAEDLLLNIVIPSIDKMNKALVVDMEINLAQHYLSSKISENIAMMLLEHFQTEGKVEGTVVIGTSVGDFHGLGKKIVIGCLRAHLFKVVDLGVNVSPETYVEAALTNNAQIIGVSSMMAHTANGPMGARGIRRLLKDRQIEDKIKLVVGGAPYRFDHELYKEVQADGWGRDGVEAVKVVKRLTLEVLT